MHDHPHHPPFQGLDDIPPLPPHAEDDDTSFFFHRLGVVERLQRKVFRTIFQEYGLHPSQGLCLITIIRNPGESQRELADRLHIERATLTVMVQKMERAGLISRQPDLNDQRILRIYPTDRGREADQKTHEACRSFMRDSFDGFSPEESAAMAAGLRRFEANIQSFYETLTCEKES